MSLIDDALLILKDAGFRVSERKPGAQALFEDDTVMGVVISYPDSQALINEWQSEQDRFLAECAPRIRLAPTKAWNMYTVHLTDSRAGIEDVGLLSKIEEDFRATRKIAKVAITREEVVQALLPLLPLQSYVAGMVESLPERLRGALMLRPETIEAILTSSPEEIAKRLLEES